MIPVGARQIVPCFNLKARSTGRGVRPIRRSNSPLQHLHREAATPAFAVNPRARRGGAVRPITRSRPRACTTIRTMGSKRTARTSRGRRQILTTAAGEHMRDPRAVVPSRSCGLMPSCRRRRHGAHLTEQMRCCVSSASLRRRADRQCERSILRAAASDDAGGADCRSAIPNAARRRGRQIFRHRGRRADRLLQHLGSRGLQAIRRQGQPQVNHGASGRRPSDGGNHDRPERSSFERGGIRRVRGFAYFA